MVLNLKEAGSKLQELVQSLRSSHEACEVRNEAGQMVAVVLPVERYRLYQQQWEKDFVTVDQIRDKMRDNDPDYVETQIVKAVAEAEVIISYETGSDSVTPSPLRGKVIEYLDPTEPAAIEDWELLK